MGKTSKEFKPSRRKFYRRVITIEVLSETPVSDNLSPADVWNECVNGEWSGDYTMGKNEVMDGPTMARLLRKQASDPSFFKLTAKGADMEDSSL